MLIHHVRYAVEPDMDRILRGNEPILPGVWHLGHIDFGPSETDWEPTHISALFATLKALNEWGSSRGDEFTVTHEGVEWVDERGVQRPMGTGTATAPVAVPKAVVALNGVTKHSTKRRRRDSLDPVIELAQSKCIDPRDTAQVFAQMEVLAQAEYAPLLAATTDGLKYTKNGSDAYLKRDALDKRLHPERRQRGRLPPQDAA